MGEIDLGVSLINVTYKDFQCVVIDHISKARNQRTRSHQGNFRRYGDRVDQVFALHRTQAYHYRFHQSTVACFPDLRTIFDSFTGESLSIIVQSNGLLDEFPRLSTATTRPPT